MSDEKKPEGVAIFGVRLTMEDFRRTLANMRQRPMREVAEYRDAMDELTRTSQEAGLYDDRKPESVE